MNLFPEKPLGIIYGHTEQFNPLFATLQQRGLPYTTIDPADHLYDPAQTDVPYSLVFHDMCVPPYANRNPVGISQAIEYTKHVERTGAPHTSSRLINGSHVAEIFSVKSRQLALFASLELPFPKTRVISSTDQFLAAAAELRFPILVKDNVGRQPMLRFETEQHLVNAYINDLLTLDGTRTVLVQECIPAKGNHIVRVETLNGQFLYAVKIYITGEQLTDWPLEVKIEWFTPNASIIQAVEEIARTARMDVGSVEYVTDRRNNNVLFYSVRPHTTSFSIQPDMPFKPVDRIVDYIEYRLLKVREIELAL